MGLGVAIGAITFSGSVIAFLKLNGNMGGKPILLPGRHVINLGVLAGDPRADRLASSTGPEPAGCSGRLTALSFAIGFLLIIPIGGADMPVVVSMLNSYSGWAAAAMGFTLHNTAMIITGALVGSLGRDPQLHHVPRDEPQLHQRDRRRLRRRSMAAGGGRRRSTGRGSAARPRTPPS